MLTAQLTQKRLKEVLDYDPLTGNLTWKVSTAHRIKVGDIAGCTTSNHAYIAIRIDNVLHLAHRLIYLFMTGVMPDQVDHADHNRQNNIWTNLEVSSDKQNRKNMSLRSDNKSGHVGVWWEARRNKWQAYIRVNGIRKFLGYFTNKADAIAAREAANIKYQYHVNHGK